jgi:hypothetical protein
MEENVEMFSKKRIRYIYQVGGITVSLINNEGVHGVILQSGLFQQSLGRADKTESFQERRLLVIWPR